MKSACHVGYAATFLTVAADIKLDFGHSCGVAEGIGPGRWQTEAGFCSGASDLTGWLWTGLIERISQD
jgi:hypothetical protein